MLTNSIGGQGKRDCSGGLFRQLRPNDRPYLLIMSRRTKVDFFSKWKDINPEQLMDSKLKCVFENPVTSTTTAKTTATTTTAKADPNTTNGKNKAVGDSVKSSPKVRNAR